MKRSDWEYAMCGKTGQDENQTGQGKNKTGQRLRLNILKKVSNRTR
jgi:hypothetical protein